MKVSIFYSWQSDLPNNTNRTLIERALEKAIGTLKAQEDLIVDPCIERDTVGVAGTPEIASTIFRKIDEAHFFVGDVSIINSRSRKGRKVPNPNVLLELGYAAHRLSWDNVLCVFNTAFGRVEELPFDLRFRRVATYTSMIAQEDRSQERERLAKLFIDALKPLLQRANDRAMIATTPVETLPSEIEAKVKGYLTDERHRIELHDLIVNKSSDLANFIRESPVPLINNLQAFFEESRARTKLCEAIIVTGCHYGSSLQHKYWIDLLERSLPLLEGTNSLRHDARRFPALLLTYAGGIAALVGNRLDTLRDILYSPKVGFPAEEDRPLLQVISRVAERDSINTARSSNQYAPMSEMLLEILRERFEYLLPNPRQYEQQFDRFEYLKSLAEVDLLGSVRTIGRFGYQFRYPENDVTQRLKAEESRLGKNWPFYEAGWFGGDRSRFGRAVEAVSQIVNQLGWF